MTIAPPRIPTAEEAIAEELRFFLDACLPRPVRTMREFAEQEIIVPDGPQQGRFRCETQPWAGVWFDAIDSGQWQTYSLSACVQMGKTLVGYVIPLLYHLFELNETVVLGVPTMEMAADKWRVDIAPVIRASRYRDLMPSTGAGSRGGKVESYTFGNGATLKFMSGGGGDATRSGYTTRVVCVTEADRIDDAGEGSRETDALSQIKARTLSFNNRARHYIECTMTIEDGAIYQHTTVNGTATKLHVKTPCCGQWVSPEREHLTGWQDAETEMDAREQARWACPACGALWDDADRAQILRGRIVPVHKGQRIDADGNVHGPLPRTMIYGQLQNAFFNAFWTAATVASKEWHAARAEDKELAERELRQFFWNMPSEPPTGLDIDLKADTIAHRIAPTLKGRLPEGTKCVTMFVDVGKKILHWAAVAWGLGGTGVVIDYGTLAVQLHRGAELGIADGLRTLRDMARAGWGGKSATRLLVDSGYMPQAVFAVARESSGYVLPTKGWGASTRSGMYSHPRDTGKSVQYVGEAYNIALVADGYLLHADVDHWKTWVHARFETTTEQGALRLYAPDFGESHGEIARHITAEQKEIGFENGKEIIRWVRKRENHWLDCLVGCAIGYHLAGGRLLIPTPRPTPPRATAPLQSRTSRRQERGEF